MQAKDLQIINGAQTVGTLGSLGAVSSDLRVLFSLTTTSNVETGFRDEITRTNNTQNEVVPWDFRANDLIQKWLEKALEPYSGQSPLPAFWYKRKRGLAPTGRGGRAVEPEYFGKLRHAYRHGPVPSYKEPKLLASTAPGSGLYPEAFGVDGVVVSVWDKTDLEEALLAYALDVSLIKRAEAYKVAGHDYARWLKRLSRYLVAIVGEVSRRDPSLKLTAKDLLRLDEATFNERVDPVLKWAMRSVNGRYDVLKPTRVQPGYDIARDQKIFVVSATRS